MMERQETLDPVDPDASRALFGRKWMLTVVKAAARFDGDTFTCRHIANLTDLTPSQVAQHLKPLEEAGVVERADVFGEFELVYEAVPGSRWDGLKQLAGAE